VKLLSVWEGAFLKRTIMNGNDVCLGYALVGRFQRLRLGAGILLNPRFAPVNLR
jgi:hypothetical protein